jgi:hypothetical protein
MTGPWGWGVALTSIWDKEPHGVVPRCPCALETFGSAA